MLATLKSRTWNLTAGACLLGMVAVQPAWAVTPASETILIDFENFTDETRIDGENVVPNVRFSAPGGAPLYAYDYAELVYEQWNGTEWIELTPPPIPGIEGLFVAGDLYEDTYVTLGFDGPYRADFLVEGVRGVSLNIGDHGLDSDSLYLQAYDDQGVLIGSVTDFIGPEDGIAPLLALTDLEVDIAYVLFGGLDNQEYNTVYFDHFSYTVVQADITPTPEPNPNPVPTPSAAAAGLGLLLGLGMRRSRRDH